MLSSNGHKSEPRETPCSILLLSLSLVLILKRWVRFKDKKILN